MTWLASRSVASGSILPLVISAARRRLSVWRTWGGADVGAPCSVCELPVARDDVTRDELEFEIQFAHDGAVPGLDKVHLHVRCFTVWELERVVGPAKL